MLLAWRFLLVEMLTWTNPTPTQPFCEGATKQRTHDRSDRIHGSDHTEILRAFGRRSGKANNAEQADSHAGTAYALDRSTDDQRGWILRYGAHDAAKLKDQDADQVPQFDRQVLEKFPPC